MATKVAIAVRPLETIKDEILRNFQEGRQLLLDSLQKARQIGILLVEASKHPEIGSHGHWTRWIEENCPFNARQARRYVQLNASWKKVEKAVEKTPDLNFTNALQLIMVRKPGGRSKGKGKPPAPEVPTPETPVVVEPVQAAPSVAQVSQQPAFAIGQELIRHIDNLSDAVIAEKQAAYQVQGDPIAIREFLKALLQGAF